jgi:hypothetical protein
VTCTAAAAYRRRTDSRRSVDCSLMTHSRVTGPSTAPERPVLMFIDTSMRLESKNVNIEVCRNRSLR